MPATGRSAAMNINVNALNRWYKACPKNTARVTLINPNEYTRLEAIRSTPVCNSIASIRVLKA
jgi:hypothetical protein